MTVVLELTVLVCLPKLHDLPGEPFELLVALLDANSPVYDFEKIKDKNKNSEDIINEATGLHD